MIVPDGPVPGVPMQSTEPTPTVAEPVPSQTGPGETGPGAPELAKLMSPDEPTERTAVGSSPSAGRVNAPADKPEQADTLPARAVRPDLRPLRPDPAAPVAQVTAAEVTDGKVAEPSPWA